MPLQLISITLSLKSSEPRKFVANSKVHNEIHIYQFVKLAFDWLLFNVYSIRNFVYKPACEFHYELLNFATNFLTSEQSLEHFSLEHSVEIDRNL